MADSLTSRYQSRGEKGDSIRKKALWLSLVQAVAVILFILLSARYVTVLVLSLKEEPVFSAPKTIYLPQRELEHQMAVAEFQNAAATPATIPALTTESLLASLPALTALPDVEFTPVETKDMVSDSDALFGQSGLMGALGALSSQASSVSFLGITEEAARFVIIVDCSNTVFGAMESAGSSMDKVKEETYHLINNLNANTKLGLIIHRRTFLPLQDTLITATVENKALAVEWIKKKWPKKKEQSIAKAISGKDGNQGILPVLDAAFSMQPNVIFIISDGGYRDQNGSKVLLDDVLSLIRSRQKELLEDARIHTIHFSDPEEDDGVIGSKMRSIAARNDGKYRKIGR